MRRRSLTPRDDWQSRVEKIGVTYHTLADGTPYWDESAYWEFSAREIDRLEAATNEIQRLALAAGDVALRAVDREPHTAAPSLRERECGPRFRGHGCA